MTPLVADTTNFPILGEPLPVELANTLYSHATGVIDFFATPELIAAWFEQAPAASPLALPRRFTYAQSEAVRDLRDAAHVILSNVVANDGVIARTQVATLNRYAARASFRPRLEWDDAVGPRSMTVYAGDRFDVFAAQLAAECIMFLCGPSSGSVRRCAHPDCEMFFVQHHRTRRFCHESCAHRARQARYYVASAHERRGSPARHSAAGAS
ncbi:MAG: ABATE domain-containing protein [Acidimicrobiales bacterium]